MKICVIDIGSNSVRLMLSEDGRTIYKKVKMTRLAENLGKERFLCPKSVERTIFAIHEFYLQAKAENPDKIYAFATAAVREANNKEEFLCKVKEKVGLFVDVVSGEVEASLGVNGALKGGEGGIIDIGGASTEVAYVSPITPYSKSYKIGAGTLTERRKNGDVKEILADIFSDLPKNLGKDFYGIGGTATSVAAMLLQLKDYDPNLVDGYVIEREKLTALRDKLSRLSVEEIAMIDGLQKGRESVIFAGVSILSYLMDKLSLERITVSESDNLEGYLEYVGGQVNE